MIDPPNPSSCTKHRPSLTQAFPSVDESGHKGRATGVYSSTSFSFYPADKAALWRDTAPEPIACRTVSFPTPAICGNPGGTGPSGSPPVAAGQISGLTQPNSAAMPASCAARPGTSVSAYTPAFPSCGPSGLQIPPWTGPRPAGPAPPDRRSRSRAPAGAGPERSPPSWRGPALPIPWHGGISRQSGFKHLPFYRDQDAQHTAYMVRAYLRDKKVRQSFPAPGTPMITPRVSPFSIHCMQHLRSWRKFWMNIWIFIAATGSTGSWA